MIPSRPFTTFIVKVASRCNLNCTYCYEYNKADQSWRTAPKIMSEGIVHATADRIAEHTRAHDLKSIYVTAHGGEALLYGAERLEGFFNTMSAVIGEGTRVHFGIQTNATLIDDEILDVLGRHSVSVGVSLDGPPAVNNQRVDHAGNASYEQTVRGISRLRAFKNGENFAGILCAIDVTSDAIEVLEHLASFQPRQIDFLEQFGTYDEPPPGAGTNGETPLADWLLKAFHHWIENPQLQHIRIRVFEDAMKLLLGGYASSEWFGLEPVPFVIVATDGAIEGLDTLKVAGTAGRLLGLHVSCNSFDDALRTPEIRARQIGKSALCDECLACPLVNLCGGGYYPTRFKSGSGFNNPSIYCQDLKSLFYGIGSYLVDHLGSDAVRIQIPIHL